MNFQVSVNNVEGFGDILSNAGCYLSIDGDFIDVITPITSSSSEYLTEIPSQGVLKFIIKNMRSGEVIGSVSINVDKLIIGVYWLPLFDDTDDDQVQNIPKVVDSPKLQVTVISEPLELPSKPSEDLRIDSRFENLQEEYTAALKRAEERDSKNLEKIKLLVENSIKFQIEINTLTTEIEKKNSENTYLQEKIHKLAIENFETQYLKEKQENENLSKLLMACDDERKQLEKRVEQAIELASSLSSIKTSSCSFHDEEMQKLQQQNGQLKQKVQELQKNSEKTISSRMEAELIRQIKDLDEKLECSELSKMELISEINELKQDFINQDKLIIEMKGFIEGSKTERLNLRDDRTKSPKLSRRKDSIDRSLEEYHAGQGIKNNFVKLSRGLYEFGTRRINVSMKNGTIVCRVGGGYVQIEDFLNIYLGSLSNSPRKQYSRNQSTSPLRNTRHSFAFLESTSGKQTPVMDSVFDSESILTYSVDSEDDRNRVLSKYHR